MHNTAMALGATFVALFIACGPGNATGPGAVVAPTELEAGGASSGPDATAPASEVDAAPGASADTHATDASGAAATAPAASDAGPKLCGCSLCQPLPSDDPCSSDSDCAPSTQCHAAACVAKAKAAPLVKTMMCTQIMACGTADANACKCNQGKCALVPRGKP
jgi:hypothetical protein